MEQTAFKKQHGEGKPKHKPKTSGEGDPFYVAYDAHNDRYVSGLQLSPRQILYSENLEDAVWSYLTAKVETFIENNEIEDVEATERIGDHPNKPPLP